MNAAAAFRVTEPSEVAVPRRTVLWLAGQIGFPDDLGGRAALVVSEMGSNLAKHARNGEILLRATQDPQGEIDGIETIAIDTGPGVPDPVRSRRDGHSTAGTLGHGLGAIERQSDSFDLYSDATGTAVVSWIARDRTAAAERLRSAYDIGGVRVAKPGEDVCGDAWAWRGRAGRLALFVVDGLGHGFNANYAAETAVQVFTRRHEQAPARFIEDVHLALKATRGAAAAMMAIETERGTALYSGLGNVAAAIVSGTGGRHHLVSANGTAGHTAARVQEFTYPVAPDSIVVMASDGLGTHWDLSKYPGLRVHSASAIAAILYRDFSRRRDDVTVVVARRRAGAG